MSRLAVYCYNPNGALAAIQEVGERVDNLTYTQVAPGGFGTLSGLVKIPQARIPLPQFALFARIAVVSRGEARWVGEQINPAYGLNNSDGSYVRLGALGIGNGLRDFPDTRSYSGKTPQQIGQAIVNAHLSSTHALSGVLSTDLSQIFPDNPALTISQVYDERTGEEILSDVSLLAGDYTWGVEADPNQVDGLGFPLGRVFARARDLSTAHYMASVADRDVVLVEFTPTANRAYNQIVLDYTNSINGISQAAAKDPRLNSDDSQGTAPFRFRRYLRDLSGLTTINGTVAANIATTYLSLFKNITYAGSVTLRVLRDGNGNVIPLAEIQAGKNILLPDLALATTSAPTSRQQGVNLFWISQATYREDSSGNAYVDLVLGYTPDTYDVRIARLQMAADQIARSGKITNIVQAMGAGLQGFYSMDVSNATAGATVGVGETWQALASQAPTSITLSPISTVNITGLAATNITAIGCRITGTVTASGAARATGTYQTVGNCLRQVDAQSARFAHHCDGCGAEHRDRAIQEHAHIRLDPYHGAEPGHSALWVACPACGRAESYHTGLTAGEEQDARHPDRAEQVRLIRRLMVATGLPTA